MRVEKRSHVRMDALQIHRRSLASGISIAPGHLFFADQRFHHNLPLNYGFHDSAELTRALQTLGALLRQQKVLEDDAK